MEEEEEEEERFMHEFHDHVSELFRRYHRSNIVKHNKEMELKKKQIRSNIQDLYETEFKRKRDFLLKSVLSKEDNIDIDQNIEETWKSVVRVHKSQQTTQ